MRYLIDVDGPENVVPEPGYTHFNVTEGTLLGPINCTATCNPECTYIWKHEEKVGRFNRYLSMQPLTIPDIKRNQTGNFRCRIDYPYANTYERTDITVNVQCKFNPWTCNSQKKTLITFQTGPLF